MATIKQILKNKRKMKKTKTESKRKKGIKRIKNRYKNIA